VLFSFLIKSESCFILVKEGLAFYHYSISSIFAIKAKQIINHSYQFNNLMWAIILIRIKKKQVSIVLLLCAIVECNMAASFFISFDFGVELCTR
jgi:hypothetical protein